MEVIGYIARTLSSKNDPYSIPFFVVQYFFIVVAPVSSCERFGSRGPLLTISGHVLSRHLYRHHGHDRPSRKAVCTTATQNHPVVVHHLRRLGYHHPSRRSRPRGGRLFKGQKSPYPQQYPLGWSGVPSCLLPALHHLSERIPVQGSKSDVSGIQAVLGCVVRRHTCSVSQDLLSVGRDRRRVAEVLVNS